MSKLVFNNLLSLAASQQPSRLPPLPIITLNPNNQDLEVGDTISLLAGATGYDTLQWQNDEVDIQGQTALALTIDNSQLNNSGSYRLGATNVTGTVYSTPAIVTVSVPANVLQPPVLTVGTPSDSYLPFTIGTVTGANNYVYLLNTSNTIVGATQYYSGGDLLGFTLMTLNPLTQYYLFVKAQDTTGAKGDSTYSAGSFTTTAITKIGSFGYSNITVIGTSIDYGYLLPDPNTQAWMAIATGLKGGSINNLAISNSGVRVSLQRFLATSGNNVTFPTTRPLVDGAGFNNAGRYGVSSPAPWDIIHTNAINAATRVICAVQFHKSFISAQNDPNITVAITGSLSGTTGTTDQLFDLCSLNNHYRINKAGYSNANYYFNRSITAGTTATVNFNITAVGEGFTPITAGCDGTVLSLSRYTITYDNGAPIMYEPTGLYYTDHLPGADNFTQAGFINDCHPKYGLSVGSHTCVITWLDSGKGAFLDGFLTLRNTQEIISATSYVYIPDLLHMIDTVPGIGTQYPNGITTNFIADFYTNKRWDDVLSVYPQFINVAISRIAFNIGFNNNDPANTQPADGVHPTVQGANELGHNAINYVN